MRRSIVVLPVLIASLAAVAGAEESAARHPRLLFGPNEIPALRRRVEHEPYASILQATRRALEHQDAKTSILYDMSPRNHAALYVVTGKQKHADQAADMVAKMIDDRKFWNNFGSKGLTRAAGALTVALAYDLCYDAWDADFRRKVSAKLHEAADGLMKSMGSGANNNIANNWQGVRYGAAGMAYLASDRPDGRKKAAKAYATLLRHLKANLGSNGWNPEGIGYTLYPLTFTGPFGIAASRAGIGDLRKDVPAMRMTIWTTLVGTVSIEHRKGQVGLRADLSDDNPVWSGQGAAAMAFWYSPKEYRSAVRWMYDYLVGPRGDESYDNRWGAGLYNLLLVPDDVKPVNPAKAVGLTYTDKSHGIALFRNRYRDANDIVALVNAHSRQPAGCHGGSDTNTFRILGLGGAFAVGAGRTTSPLGQTNLFPGQPPQRAPGGLGTLVDADFTEDGGGLAVAEGSCMGTEDHLRRFRVDYSGDCGAPALFVNSDISRNGKVWRLNTPEFNEIRTDGNRFTLISPNGATLACTVVEPASVKFRTGKVERGGGMGHTAFPYRGTKYAYNKYIEFDVQGRACVIMTLQMGNAPEVSVRRYLHGAVAEVGDVTVGYEKQTGTVALGDKAAAMKLASRSEPLMVRGVDARVRADTEVQLRWIPEPRGETELLVQRSPAGDDRWQSVAKLQPKVRRYLDKGLDPNTAYQYRVLARNEHGLSVADGIHKVHTWEEGYREHVEDYAARKGGKLPQENAIARWKSVAREGMKFSFSDGLGSDRGAEAEKGCLSIGYVPIRRTKAVYTDDIRCDLSGKFAAVEFDVSCQATTCYSVMVKLADGSWWITRRRFIASRRKWTTLRYPIASQEWEPVDAGKLTRLADGKRRKLTDEQLKDVRGVGIWVDWVINRKWAKIDQFHLRARGLKRTDSPR